MTATGLIHLPFDPEPRLLFLTPDLKAVVGEVPLGHDVTIEVKGVKVVFIHTVCGASRCLGWLGILPSLQWQHKRGLELGDYALQTCVTAD